MIYGVVYFGKKIAECKWYIWLGFLGKIATALLFLVFMKIPRKQFLQFHDKLVTSLGVETVRERESVTVSSFCSIFAK